VLCTCLIIGDRDRAVARFSLPGRGTGGVTQPCSGMPAPVVRKPAAPAGDPGSHQGTCGIPDFLYFLLIEMSAKVGGHLYTQRDGAGDWNRLTTSKGGSASHLNQAWQRDSETFIYTDCYY